eukprot:TRINITY_DN426_c0_g1_i3.p1 TRINITY_DN426_c0_g1~~TRINITY_DN426_c0_g1_i3.p1  ORF type:complete len:125 (-),score=21.08 TRINITY_DN426_c0_g1_i3:50-424(-)
MRALAQDARAQAPCKAKERGAHYHTKLVDRHSASQRPPARGRTHTHNITLPWVPQEDKMYDFTNTTYVPGTSYHTAYIELISLIRYQLPGEYQVTTVRRAAPSPPSSRKICATIYSRQLTPNIS